MMKASARARRVTALVLGDPANDSAANWMEIGPREDGITVVSEAFARRRLPPRALTAMRAGACFYMFVDDVNAAAVHVPGRRLDKPVTRHGMRELCIESPSGVVVLAEQVYDTATGERVSPDADA